MTFDLTSHIENQLKNIIDEAIQSGKIDTDKLRMIIISPNQTFDTLKVIYNNSWDDYYYGLDYSDGAEIGSISITEWLDAADIAFEKRDALDDSYTHKAKEHNKKYFKHKPAIQFDHITEINYKNYLICLREEVINQIEKAIKNVAISYTQEDFTHVVGFVTYRLTYHRDEQIEIIAFNHPEGSGPFYNVMLTLPQSKLTYPYLKFYDSGFLLFYPESNIYEGSNDESHIYNYTIKDVKYAYVDSRRREEVIFRLTDEFEDWNLSGGHINEEFGDFTEEQFFEAFHNFIQQFPDKILDKDTIPNPITHEADFQNWLSNIIENNLQVTYDHRETMLNYGEETYGKLLQLLPETHQSWDGIQQFLASHFFKQNRYEEALEILQSLKKISDHTKIHVLQNLYYLNQKEEFDQLHQSLEGKTSKRQGMLIKWLYDISLHKDQPEQLQELKSEIQAFVEENKGYTYGGSAVIALVKVLAYLEETREALFNFQNISFSYDIDKQLYLKEFAEFDYLMDRYQIYINQKQQEENFKAKTKADSLIIPETDSIDTPKPKHKDCFYVVKEIKDHGSDWAHPIHQNRFLAESERGKLYLGEITESYEVIKHDTITLDSKYRYHYAYDKETLYISIKNEGIVRYQIQGNTLTLLDGVYKNSQKPSAYGNLTVYEDYLYVCNDEYLEIFDLSNPGAPPLSSTLFVDSGYHFYCNDDLLVVGAGGGLVILVDIKDKTNPQYLSTIIEDQTPGSMHVEFVDHYLISRSVIDISDPKNPKFVCHTQDKLTPSFSFDNSLPKEVYATQGDLALKKLELSSSDITVTGWIPLYEERKEHEQNLTGNTAVVFSEDTLIAFTSYEIYILKRGENPKYEQQTFDLQQPLEAMALQSFNYLINTKPDFKISKVIFRKEVSYGSITFSLQGSSSTAIFLDPHAESNVPKMHADFNLYPYFYDEFEINYNPEIMALQYDLETIINKIISDPRFSNIAARHVSIITDKESRYLNFPENSWSPYREESTSKNQKSIIGIVTSGNDNLLRKLKDEMNEDSNIFEELVNLLNTNIDKDRDLSVKKPLNQSSDSLKPQFPSFIQGPNIIQDQEQEPLPDLKTAKREAFRIICSYQDHEAVKNIILNGARYGIPRPHISEIPEEFKPKKSYIKILTENWYGLWDKFSADTAVKEFLLSQLDTLEDKVLASNIAYQYELYTHNSIKTLLKTLLDDPYPKLNYYGYTGEHADLPINFSKLPPEVFKEFEQELLAIYNAYDTADPDDIPYRLKELITPVTDMLHKLGHANFPDKLLGKLKSAKQYHEQFDDNMFGDDDYENEESFLLRLHRAQLIKTILKKFAPGNESPIWETDTPPEPYKKSWYNVLDLVFEQGKELYGAGFPKDFVTRLSSNIAKDEAYDTDRILAFNFVHYTFKKIQDHPELASLTEDLVIAIEANKDKFTEEIDLYQIKEKSKFALLQAAWNHLTNKDWDLAERKGDAILQIDPEFGQVYFLKARLLWLKSGISAYLERKDEFIEKASHDAAALARLYNLTGCALDVQKKYEESLPYFKNAALTGTNEPMYIANIAEVYYKLKDPKQALNYAEKAKQKGYSSKMMDVIRKNKGIIPEEVE